MDNLYTSKKRDAPIEVPIDATFGAESSKSSKLPEQLKEEISNVKARADFLLPGLGKAPREAVEYFVKMQYARAQTQENPWYRLAMKISAFSGEPMSKMWKQQQDVERGQALLNETTGGLYSAIDSASGDYEGSDLVQAMGDYMSQQSETDVANYVRNRRDFFLSPQVFAKLFFTPLLYGHINEARDMIERHCNYRINMQEFIESEHVTYFARLVALRMQMSRFLSGRYYSLSGNYNRLMTQTARMLNYFKVKLGSAAPSSRPMLRMIPDSRGDRAFVNQNLNYQPPSRGASYLHKLNQV